MCKVNIFSSNSSVIVREILAVVENFLARAIISHSISRGSIRHADIADGWIVVDYAEFPRTAN